jgi:hypothetical protein
VRSVSYANYKRIASQRNNSSCDSDDLIQTQQEQKKLNQNCENDPCEKEIIDCFDNYETNCSESTNQIRPVLRKSTLRSTEVPEWLKKDLLDADFIPIEVLEKKESAAVNIHSITENLSQKLENLNLITVRKINNFTFCFFD